MRAWQTDHFKGIYIQTNASFRHAKHLKSEYRITETYE